MPPTPEELEECTRVLEEIASDRAGLAEIDLELRTRLLTAAGRVSRPERDEQRRLSRTLLRKKKKERRTADEALLDRAGIRRQRLLPVFVTPGPDARLLAAGGVSGGPPRPAAETETETEELSNARVCYVCKAEMRRPHAFYDQMCGACGDFNFGKRNQTADLTGRVALITGARVKIGYQAAILLLRAGAHVVVTTRFPRDAALRYSREVDFESFRDRLEIYGLDLRHTPSVEAFARHLGHGRRGLDFVLHNACQTVRRPAGFYRHLMELEVGPPSAVPELARSILEEYEAMRAGTPSPRLERKHTAGDARAIAVGLHAAPSLSQVALTAEDLDTTPTLFPAGQLDADLQQVDLRSVNSWRLPLDQVGTVELLEVQLVNAIAPFVLNARLKPLLLRDRSNDKHIVNVSAMEGQFYRRFKTDKHPHTNMAKAALNMMTRTSAPDYVKDGIHMNSVDTGWVTDEDPAHIADRKRAENGFHPPLDIVDGAARIVDPIFDGMNTGRHVWGQFLKDYRPAPW
jgi:NAD(P)-dependent dehydrogenase (short-subunit alcohol dehydrogenase family)